MYSLATRNVSSSVCSSRTLQAKVAVIAPVLRSRQTRVVVRSSDYSSSSGEEVQAQLQNTWEKTSQQIKATWEDTADAEKPAIIAIVIAVSVAQLSIGATLDVVERLPLAKPFFEFVGLAVVAVYGYRYFTAPGVREGWRKKIDSFVSSVTGQ